MRQDIARYDEENCHHGMAGIEDPDERILDGVLILLVVAPAVHNNIGVREGHMELADVVVSEVAR